MSEIAYARRKCTVGLQQNLRLRWNTTPEILWASRCAAVTLCAGYLAPGYSLIPVTRQVVFDTGYKPGQ
jgi:hypothetical protein